MPARHTAPAQPTVSRPTRFIDTRLRPDTDRAVIRASTLLAGVALAIRGVHATDTPDHARRLDGMLAAVEGEIGTARRLLQQRAGIA